MNYQIMPIGKIWENGMFSVPSSVAKSYIKLASEYQLKALLLILSNSGQASSREIAKTLGCTESDADDFLEFWVDEGVLIRDSKMPAKETKKEEPSTKKEAQKQIAPKKELENMPVPVLSPKDIAALLRENSELETLLQNSQEVLGRTISHAEQEMIVNMVLYYGLPCEVVLTILHYYKTEKSRGRAIGNAYICAMAKNWSEEGITSLAAADEKLRELESSNRLWEEILAAASIRFRNPTLNQREMIKIWTQEFSFEMIAYACELMKENAQKPTLKYVDKILQNWQKSGIKTIDAAKEDNENHRAKSDNEKSGKLKGKPSFDISEIEKKALFDDDYDI